MRQRYAGRLRASRLSAPNGRCPHPATHARTGLTRRPRGPHPTTRANPYGLTKRQPEVPGLLREGLSDAEIAARLVITTKTASSHVSAILAKLGVRTRHQAARRLSSS
jgi:DNA-binding NarL/FixJ family response regulator